MHASLAVQTSARDTAEPDLFGIDLAAGADMTAVYMVLVGRVTEDAKLRIQGYGLDHKPHAVVAVELRYESSASNTVHAEQAFDLAHRATAEGLVARLRRGTVVSVVYPVSFQHVVLRNVFSITPVQA